MILAQSVLALPIVVALTHRALEGLWAAYGDALIMDGASKSRAIATLLSAARTGMVTIFLAAFGRAIAEVEAILIVVRTGCDAVTLCLPLSLSFCQNRTPLRSPTLRLERSSPCHQEYHADILQQCKKLIQLRLR